MSHLCTPLTVKAVLLVLPLVPCSRFIVMAQVRHSQSVRVPPLLPWIAAEKNGAILRAHCTCKAGLGEACNHISALLFTAEAHNRLKKDRSCTSQLHVCAWLPPSMQDVMFAPFSDIYFKVPATYRKNSLSIIIAMCWLHMKITHSETGFTVMPSPSQKELAAFYQHLSQTGKPALLSILLDYSDLNAEDCMLSDPLPTLFKEDLITLKYDDLLLKCEMFNSLNITEKQAKQMESATRDQVHSKLWFCYRAGCVTASNFKATAYNDQSRPLLKAICYPERYF